MIQLRLIITLFFSLLCASLTWSSDRAMINKGDKFISCLNAPDDFYKLNNIKIQVIEKINNKCMLSISSVNNYPQYRNYMFNSDGELIVFNSFDGGVPADSTGARSYIFFEKKNDLQFRIKEKQIQVKTQAGYIFSFSAKSGDLSKIDGLYYTFDEEVRADNFGGLDLHPMTGLILDEGWKQGKFPRLYLNRNSLFKDSLGHLCSRENSELFKHVLDSRGIMDGAFFQYPSKSELAHYLRSHCPSIVL
jgi:hypothetical protein